MSPGSPTAFLLWAILSSLFLLFVCVHLWGFDRFRCLRWWDSAAHTPGAFKRFMTYCYLLTPPLIFVFSTATAYLKFQEGYLIIGDDVYPKPTILWTRAHQRWLSPLNFVIAAIWTLEFTTHLEELTFSLFLVHQGAIPRDWFRSWEHTLWRAGAFAALCAFPTLALVVRGDVLAGDAALFAAGGGAALAVTLAFLPVLARFPRFLATVKAGGAGADALRRLRAFWILNLIRVAFRFLFTVPLLVVAADALRGEHAASALLAEYPAAGEAQGALTLARAGGQSGPLAQFRHDYPVLSHAFLVDCMLLLSALGCFVSSGATVLIFFPWPAPADAATASFAQQTSAYDDAGPSPRYEAHGADLAWDADAPPPRRHSMGSVVLAQAHDRRAPAWTPRGHSARATPVPVPVHPYVEHFTSPIDLHDMRASGEV